MKYLRFIAAVAVGLMAALVVPDAPVTLLGIWLMLIALARRERVTLEREEQRLAFCRDCPVFYPRLKTCGSPLRWRDRDVGCWCYMPMKAKLPRATCWLREQGVDRGWPDDL